MRKIFWIAALLCAIPASAQNDEEHVKYTKFQKQAAGYWLVTEPQNEAHVQWLAIYLGDTRNTMTVRWPTDKGCQSETAEMHADTINVAGDFPAVIQMDGPRTGTVKMYDGRIILHIKKTKDKTDSACK
jgi:hypothetical protein